MSKILSKIIPVLFVCMILANTIFARDWQNILNDKGKLSIEFAGKPTLLDEPPLPKNDYFETYIYQLDDKENNCTYSAVFKFIPDKIKAKYYNKYFEEYIKGIPQKWSAELLETSTLKNENPKITELVMKLFPEINIRLQVLRHNDIIYEISIIGNPDIIKNSDSEHFFNSFKLLK